MKRADGLKREDHTMGGFRGSGSAPFRLAAAWYRAAIRSHSLRAAVLFAISGAAFAIGNLLLARRLPVAEYGSLVLAVAIYMVLAQLAPLGTDQMVIRRALTYRRKTAAFQAISGLMIGCVAALGIREFASFPWIAAAALGGAVASGALLVGVSAEMRARGWGFAPMVFAAPSFVLLVIGVAAQLVPSPGLETTLIAFALGLLVLALAAVLLTLRHASYTAPAAVRWLDIVPIVGVVAVATISNQFDRLLLPLLLGLGDVATFSVLSSLAIFPFRLLDAGVNFTLTPRLSKAGDPRLAYGAFKAELGITAAFLVIACGGIVLLAPAVAFHLTDGRYELSVLLVICACLSGLAKLMHGFLRSIAVALGTSQELYQVNACGWIALTVAALCAAAGSRFGLAGFVAGSASGYGAVMAPALAIAVLRLRARAQQRSAS